MFFLRSILAIVSIMAVLASTPGHAKGTLIGSWTGNLTCGAYQGSVFIKTDGEPAPGMFSGTLSFELKRDFSKSLTGSYSFAARLLEDGSFAIKPREWIERPSRAEFVLDFEGKLNEDGWQIEGAVPLCARGRFKASLDDFDMGQIGLLAALQPPGGGPAQGNWTGYLHCAFGRRNGPEQYPLELSLWQDAGNVGGIARLSIYEKFGSNSGPSVVQTTLFRGRVEGERLILDRTMHIETGGRGNQMHSLSANFMQSGELAGSPNYAGCETLELTRVSPVPASPPFDLLADGPRGGIVGTGNDALMSVRSGSDGATPFVEIRAHKPLSRPETERERLRVLLAPVMAGEGWMVAVPISYPEVVGKFDRSTTLGFIGDMMAFVFVAQADGTMQITAAPNLTYYRPALANSPLGGSATVSVGRLDGDGLEMMAGGQMPQIDLGPGIGGALASAGSRQEQCRILENWIGPHAEGQELRQASHYAVLMPAFDDGIFGPVFGTPFDFLTGGNLTGLSTLTRFCAGNMKLRLVGELGRQIFDSPENHRRFMASLVNRRDTSRWFASAVEEIEGLPATADGLAHLKKVDPDLRRRARELPAAERDSLVSLVTTRTKEIEAAIAAAKRAELIAGLMNDAQTLPDSGYDDGSLNSVFRFMKRVYDQGLAMQESAPLRQIAQAKADSILAPVFQKAQVLAATAPSSADGLADMMSLYNHLRPARSDMDRYFGTIDRNGNLRSFHTRLGELWNDEQIREEVTARLAALYIGANFQRVIWEEASRYIDRDRPQHAPGYHEAIARLIDDAEVKHVRIIDLSVNQDPGEPTAQEIAHFVLSRVRNLNSGTASMEQACLSGAVNDPVMAFACLAAPGMYSGQSGTAVRLLAVTKITCETEVADRQYWCTFLQEIDINLPGASQSGLGGVTALASGLASNEPIDARFIRAAGGGWNVIWGDLKR